MLHSAGFGAGYPVDYYMYVTDSSSTYCQGTVSATGVACQLGGTANRPILGVANLCPRYAARWSTSRAVAGTVYGSIWQRLHTLCQVQHSTGAGAG